MTTSETNPPKNFTILGKKVQKPARNLETFPNPSNCYRIIMESDEVTSLCPVTGQPDQYTVTIDYYPQDSCIESKSLKLYLWAFREEGHFCEALSDRIAKDIYEACRPHDVIVTVKQKPRGGIGIRARSSYPKVDEFIYGDRNGGGEL